MEKQESRGTRYSIRGFKSNHEILKRNFLQRKHLFEQLSHRHGRIPITGGFKDVIGRSASLLWAPFSLKVGPDDLFRSLPTEAIILLILTE